MLNKLLFSILRPNGKLHFISRLESHASILDVGCGNNSPFKTKDLLPNCKYTGIDVGNHNQTRPLLADNYILVGPDKFADAVNQFDNEFDAVVSSHNLEHCNNRDSVLLGMLDAVKVDGKIFISFPCAESVNFPRRQGTLNYFDDDTHMYSPPIFEEVVKKCKQRGFRILYSEKRYSPMFLRILGFILEPLSRVKAKCLRGTWEYWGFESIIIAKKENPSA